MRCEDVRYARAGGVVPLRKSMSSKSPLFSRSTKILLMLSCVLGPFIPPFGCRDLRLLAPSTRSRSSISRGPPPPSSCLPPGPATIEPNNNRNHEARPLHSSCRFCCRFCSWCSGFPFGYPAARVQGAITKEIVAGYFRLSTLLS